MPSGTDLRIEGDGVAITMRSRPSDLAIADECTALLARLPGSAVGVRVVGVDPWDDAGAPGRLVEYARPDESGTHFVEHLLITTGRHRIDVVAERSITDLDDTDGAVFNVLETVRIIGPAAGGRSTRLEEIVVAEPSVPTLQMVIDQPALTTLQSLAGRRWNPAALRTPGGRTLVSAGVIGRFGTVPPSTAAIMAPWEADTEPVTFEQHGPGETRARLQAWRAGASMTLVDGIDEIRIGTSTPDDAVAYVARMLDVAPTWTWPFATGVLPSVLLDERLRGKHVGLPADAARDEVLRRFWEARWTATYVRRPGGQHPATLVRAEGIGFARVGRTDDGVTAFRVEAPANVYRLIVRCLLGA